MVKDEMAKNTFSEKLDNKCIQIRYIITCFVINHGLASWYGTNFIYLYDMNTNVTFELYVVVFLNSNFFNLKKSL